MSCKRTLALHFLVFQMFWELSRSERVRGAQTVLSYYNLNAVLNIFAYEIVFGAHWILIVTFAIAHF